MTRDEAIALARQTAEARGWPWEGEVRAELYCHRPLLSRLFGRGGGSSEWNIVTNYRMKGRNIRIRIDDDTGEVISAHFAPR